MPNTRQGSRTPALLIALLGILTALLWLPARMQFPFDDTYITFRYSRNLAHGLGIVWNPGGAHTEGYTNFLFMVLLAPFSAMGLDLLVVSQAMNVAAAIITAFAIWKIVEDSEIPRSRIFAWFAVALFYADPFTWFNVYSGMETTLFSMFVALTIFSAQRLVKQSSDWLQMLPAFLFAVCATLTRPEGALFGIIIPVAALFRRGEHSSIDKQSFWKIFRAAVIGFVLPLMIYAIWKLLYFGDLLPNSFYVKVAQANPNHTLTPGRGALASYYFRAWYLVIPVLALFWFALLSRAAILSHRYGLTLKIGALWLCLMSAFYLFSQFMMPNFNRFFNATEVMLIILTAIAVQEFVKYIETRPGARTTHSKGTIVAILSLAVFAHVLLSFYTRYGMMWLTWDTSYEQHAMRVVPILESLPDHRNISLATGDAGILPYYADVQHLDLVGLNTTPIAHAGSTDEVLRYVDRSRPDILFIPMDIPKDSLSDSCQHIIRWGHGLIGQSGYPRLVQQAESEGYTSVATIDEIVYDFNVLVNPASPHATDITHAFTTQLGHNPTIGKPVSCMR